MALIVNERAQATKNSIVKSASIQSPATIAKRARGPSADHYWSFSGAVRVFERIRLDHIVSSIRANLRNLFDQTAYQHFTLSREIALVFTSQGPLPYRCACGLRAGDLRQPTIRARLQRMRDHQADAKQSWRSSRGLSAGDPL
jgi:hypothetical protein